MLYDAGTAEESGFLGFAQVTAFLQKAGLSDDPSEVGLFIPRDGVQEDAYLTDTGKAFGAAESFLAKVQRSEPTSTSTLELLSRQVKFEHSHRCDQTGRYYLYSGRVSGTGSSGVFVRDLSDNTTRTLVASDGQADSL